MATRTAQSETITISAVANLTERINDLLLSPAKPPCKRTIPDLLRERLNEYPDVPAVQFETEAPVTLRELSNLADSIRQIVRITRNSIVPICMHRSVLMLASMLAVMRAGAAYVILDPEYPIERKTFIISDLDAEYVLTDNDNAGGFSNGVNVEELISQYESSGEESFLDLSHYESTAYIVYTSGSTSMPKGVVIPHVAASSGMSCVGLSGHARWLLFFNPNSSAAQRAIWGTIIQGGCVCLASKSSLTDRLSEIINEMEIDGLRITPSALTLLSPENVPSLKQIIMVGERVHQNIVLNWADKVELWNFYGLSECIHLNFGKRLNLDSRPTHVGRPLDTTTAYILRPDSMEAMPFGSEGELCLAGPQVANGYWNRKSETAATFLDNPFGPGKILRTGDLAIQHEDGTFDIIGRTDFRVKIAGQRVAPEEVSAALSKYPNLDSCTVFGATIGEETRLVAAIVTKTSTKLRLEVPKIREFLSGFLPAYMIPSYWMEFESIPLNANNKADIAFLRKHAEGLGSDGLLQLLRAESANGISQGLEETIQTIWAEVLGLRVGSISRYSSFTELGGTSIQALRVLAELRKLGFTCGLGDIIQSENLAAFTTVAKANQNPIEDLRHDSPPFSLIKDLSSRKRYQNSIGVINAYPALPMQIFMLGASKAGTKGYLYQRIWRLDGIDLQRLRAAFEIVFRQSDIIRTMFVPDRTAKVLQIVREDMELPWKEISAPLQQFLDDDLEDELLPEVLPWRVTAVQDALVVSSHHAVFDFWSQRFIYQDVAKAYHGQSLIPRPAFSNYVSWVEEQDAAPAKLFWDEYLRDAPRTLLRPPRTPIPYRVSKTVDFNIVRTAAKSGLTIASVVFTAWAIVLAKRTSQRTVTFAAVVGNRDAPVDGLERIDGPTFTMANLKVKLEGARNAASIANEISTDLISISKYSNYRTRQLIEALSKPPPPFDTFVNIQLAPRVKEDEDYAMSVFREYQKRRVTEPRYTNLYVMEDGDDLVIDVAGAVEEAVLKDLLSEFSEAMIKIIDLSGDIDIDLMI